MITRTAVLFFFVTCYIDGGKLELLLPFLSWLGLDIPVNTTSQFGEQDSTITSRYPSQLPIETVICILNNSVTCNNSRYRTINGTCNNLKNPTWGAASMPYGRILKSKYGDGVSSLPTSENGNALPNPRNLSLTFFPDEKRYNEKYTLITMQWGQVMTHDMSFTAGVNQIGSQGGCCRDGQTLENKCNPRCAAIVIPENDPDHPPGSCINFIRTQTTKDVGCTGPDMPAEQLTPITGYMDASLIYGSSVSQAASIRELEGGRLKFEERLGQIWPPRDPDSTNTCTLKSPDEPCYLAGDLRVNQNPHLTLLQIILFREHNRIATVLARQNSDWDDEKIFEETRRIIIAEYQHICYYEHLPNLIGRGNMIAKKIIYPKAQGYINDYDSTVNPTVANEHATAAFRHFHSLIRGHLDMFTQARRNIGSLRLSEWYDRPPLERTNNSFNDLTRGLIDEAMSDSDQYFDGEVTKFLFQNRFNGPYGQDLRAIDIQRGRDHGLGSYISARAVCKLPVPSTFEQMTDFISEKNVQLLRKIYSSPNDVDLVVGGSLEKIVPGTEAGPTFLCILLDTFYRTRVGDRFFYENGSDKKIAFSLPQLRSIRRTSLARLICDNTGVIHIQPHAFLQTSITNSPISCENIPGIDLTLWRETS